MKRDDREKYRSKITHTYPDNCQCLSFSSSNSWVTGAISTNLEIFHMGLRNKRADESSTWLQSLHPGTLPKQDLPNSGEKQDASVPPDLKIQIFKFQLTFLNLFYLDDPIHLTLQLPSASQACEQSPSRTSDLLFLIPVSDMTSATADSSSKHRAARILCGPGVEMMMEWRSTLI